MADYAYLLEHRLSLSQRGVLEKVRDSAREHGMTVFLTGGAVRDLATGFPVRDLDFTVQGNALKLKKSLEKADAELWGEHEPSRTLFFWFRGVRVEVSSARSEEYPKPGKPVYRWAPMQEDLRRRDFTANAMAVSLNEGSYGLLLDPLNGIADLEGRTLRLVNPYGFIEDPSRLLRAARLQARTGWEMDERTRVRYDNAKEEGAISAISPYLKGYELEEIAHEEDALKAFKALESEGWMKQIFPAWTSARVDTHGLEALHETLLNLLIQGIHPDIAAAQMELMTAKMQPKEVSALKRLFPRGGFVKHWEKLDQAAKEFQKALLDKKNAAPSATWKLLTGYAPEPVLWLAYSSKSAPVQTKFRNFLTVWPEARQKIPTVLMQDMRITPDLPGYDDLVQEIFFHLMDGKLSTDEEMRAFLEPYSPPAPPPPVSVRRTRAKKARVAAEEEIEEHAGDLEDLHDEDHDHEHDHDHEEEEESSVRLAPAPKRPAKTPAAEKPAKAAKSHETAARPEKAAVSAKATKPVKTAKSPAPAPAKVVDKAVKHGSAAKKVEKKPSIKPVKKAEAKPSKKAPSKPSAKKPSKPAKKKR